MTESRKPWLPHYDADVPASLAPYPRRTLLDYVAETANATPDLPALLFKGATISYGELDRLSEAAAAAFVTLGVGRNDRVGLLLPNCPQFFIAELGAWKVGASSPAWDRVFGELVPSWQSARLARDEHARAEQPGERQDQCRQARYPKRDSCRQGPVEDRQDRRGRWQGRWRGSPSSSTWRCRTGYDPSSPRTTCCSCRPSPQKPPCCPSCHRSRQPGCSWS